MEINNKDLDRNDKETENTIQRINETKNFFLEKIS
jgi:hypothetical protein